MNMYLFRSVALLSALMMAMFLRAQAGDAPAAPPASQEQHQALDPIQGAWSSGNIPRAGNTVQAERSHREEVNMSGAVQLNEFRALRSDALARGKGQLTEADRQTLGSMAAALSTSAPGSFEALLAQYHMAFPAPAAFTALQQALAIDSERPLSIAPALTLAALRNDTEALTDRARALRQSGMVPTGLWLHAEDMFRCVEQGGVLLANGDMDVLPLLALQHGEGIRTDVLVVDRRLLGDDTYRERVWRSSGASGKVPSGSGPDFGQRLATASVRPVHLANSLDRAWLEPLAKDLHTVGLVFRHGKRSMDNIPLLEHHWEGMHRTTEAGPLSWNYLLPGAVLLAYYRVVDDEAKAARMEHQLVTFAKRIGALAELQRLGVLLH